MNCHPEDPRSWQGSCQKELAQHMEVPYQKLVDGIYINPSEINRPGMDWSEQQMYQAMYQHRVGNENNETEQAFYRICQSVPGLCQRYLSDRCINQTPATLARNPYKVYWCGCHLPNDHYEEIFNKYGVSPPCHSMCARSGNVPMTNPDSTRRVCDQNVCIMDNNMLILNQGRGGTKFNQYCGGCAKTGQSGCNCLISNNNVAQTMGRLGGSDTSIDQTCGSTKCFIPGDKPGEVREVPCQLEGSKILGQNTNELASTAKVITSNWYMVIFILIVLLVVIIVLVCFIVSWFDLGKNWKFPNSIKNFSLIHDRHNNNKSIHNYF